MYRLSATTRATGSPTNFTSPSASGGRGVSGDVLARDRVPRLLDVRVEVLGREHRAHTGQREGRGGVDAVDLRVGEGAAHEAGVQHAGPGDVVDEGAAAGEKAVVFDARDAGARVSGRNRVSHAITPLERLKSDVIASESDISTPFVSSSQS